jgi:hypothetical protein
MALKEKMQIHSGHRLAYVHKWGAKIFGVFRVKNYYFTPKNLIFSIAEGGAKIFEVFRVKNHDFSPPPESAPGTW